MAVFFEGEVMDFIQRMEVEKQELDEKLAKLKQFLSSDRMDLISNPMRELMLTQEDAMMTYSRALGERLAILKSQEPV
jgi:hypothetical protein